MEISLKHMEISSETHGKITRRRKFSRKLSIDDNNEFSFKHLHGNTRLVISPLIIDGF